MSVHHRRPRSKNGTNEPRNISNVSDKKHRAFHLIFSNWTPYQIAHELNTTWIDPDFEFIVQRKSDRRYMEET
jgi:hypothetical protein